LASLTHLHLSYSGLSGLVPQEISHLSKLVSLDLSGNDLYLQNLAIKRLVQNMTTLRDVMFSGVDMSHLSSNPQMRGHFPKSNWTSLLKFLDVIGTRFSGGLPNSIGGLKFLEDLNVEGTGELPDSIGNLVSLKSLYLTGSFAGSIPASIGNLTQITDIHLSDQNFIGELPFSLGKLEHLTSLTLDGNNFSGQLPFSLFNLTQLVLVDFSNNQLTGPIPTTVNSHSSLVSLNLAFNLLTETIPSSLEYLDLSYNQLDGHISPLSYVDLSNNKLHGPIPRSLFGLVHLTGLILSSNNMTGIFDTEMISELKELRDLGLSYKSLSLSLPSSNEKFSFPMFTYLSLSSCNLREIPTFLKDSKFLQHLDLSSSKIQGPLPDCFWGLGEASLTYLNLSHNFLTRYVLLSNNKLTGEIPFSICNNSDMIILDLSINRLNGKIPHCLGKLSYYLTVSDLWMNNFQGVIPTKFANCESLRILSLNGNQLEGPLPHSLLNCKDLEVLDVGNNTISGEFPHWLGTLPKLRVLVLISNKFHGAIVSSKTKTSFSYNLKAMLSVGRNELQEVQYVGQKDLYSQWDDVMRLKSLEERNFSHNNLVRCIPPSIGISTNLEWLDLSSNQLACRIPQKLLDQTFLEVLNLSCYKLEGPIPEGKQFNTFSKESYLGNLGLSGFPLSKLCYQSETPQPPQQNVSGSIIEFGWQVVLLGYGCGVIFGLIMGYIVFSIGKPQWLVMLAEQIQPRKLKRSKLGARRRLRGN
ncbi:hypothetical protein V6Z11_D01G037700, partial [Gossypium hirsutum]